jgi:hypothetical protein
MNTGSGVGPSNGGMAHLRKKRIQCDYEAAGVPDQWDLGVVDFHSRRGPVYQCALPDDGL